MLDAAMGGCHGKQTGEAALRRTLVDQVVEPDDIILADRLFGTYLDPATVPLHAPLGLGEPYDRKKMARMLFGV